MNSLPPFALVIFGATGDLTHRKLMPALFTLFVDGYIPEQSVIIGFARRPYAPDAFCAEMYQSVMESTVGPTVTKKLWNTFCKTLEYQMGTFDDISAYNALSLRLKRFDDAQKACTNKIFYLATPPNYYETILDNLKSSGLLIGRKEGRAPSEVRQLADEVGTRIAIEKPFGKDLKTAIHLDEKLSTLFDERQIYRVDHYLGKETIQNILAIRFANSLFEPIWNSTHIDHVQITMAEKNGVGTRGQFYDGIGALRDVAQNHLLMIMALVGMEQPDRFTSDSVREARCKLINQIQSISEKDILTSVVRGQYDSGTFGTTEVREYRQEPRVDPSSTTETFAAMKLFIDNTRWRGVPFYLRTGKRLPQDIVEVSLVFRQTCHLLFKEVGCPEESNVLSINLGKRPGFGLRFIGKKPGTEFKLESVDTEIRYKKGDGYDEKTRAYERLLLDIFHGEQMLFNRSDELQSSWELISTILRNWEKAKPHFPNYQPGTWGPREANELIERDGRQWIVGLSPTS